MALSEINTVPTSPEEFNSWGFTHMTFHRDTIRVIFQQYDQNLTEYILHPFNPNDMGTWLYHHQEMHFAQNQMLGIRGYDLNSLDWQDPNSVRDWFSKHSDEHTLVGQILNLG